MKDLYKLCAVLYDGMKNSSHCTHEIRDDTGYRKYNLVSDYGQISLEIYINSMINSPNMILYITEDGSDGIFLTSRKKETNTMYSKCTSTLALSSGTNIIVNWEMITNKYTKAPNIIEISDRSGFEIVNQFEFDITQEDKAFQLSTVCDFDLENTKHVMGYGEQIKSFPKNVNVFVDSSTGVLDLIDIFIDDLSTLFEEQRQQ